jgi:hypothetical protein
MTEVLKANVYIANNGAVWALYMTTIIPGYIIFTSLVDLSVLHQIHYELADPPVFWARSYFFATENEDKNTA